MSEWIENAVKAVLTAVVPFLVELVFKCMRGKR